MSSATQRTLKYLRAEGYTCCIVEYYHAYARVRKDMYGWIDIAALHPDKHGVLGVQSTVASHLAERIKKAEALPAYKLWLDCGNSAMFIGWRKVGPRGKMKRWEPLIRHAALHDPIDDIFQ